MECFNWNMMLLFRLVWNSNGIFQFKFFFLPFQIYFPSLCGAWWSIERLKARFWFILWKKELFKLVNRIIERWFEQWCYFIVNFYRFYSIFRFWFSKWKWENFKLVVVFSCLHVLNLSSSTWDASICLSGTFLLNIYSAIFHWPHRTKKLDEMAEPQSLSMWASHDNRMSSKFFKANLSYVAYAWVFFLEIDIFEWRWCV